MGYKVNDMNISVTHRCDLKKEKLFYSIAIGFALSYNLYSQIQTILSIFRYAVK